MQLEDLVGNDDHEQAPPPPRWKWYARLKEYSFDMFVKKYRPDYWQGLHNEQVKQKKTRMAKIKNILFSVCIIFLHIYLNFWSENFEHDFDTLVKRSRTAVEQNSRNKLKLQLIGVIGLL